jgi:Alpha/beta hydrolase domain
MGTRPSFEHQLAGMSRCSRFAGMGIPLLILLLASGCSQADEQTQRDPSKPSTIMPTPDGGQQPSGSQGLDAGADSSLAPVTADAGGSLATNPRDAAQASPPQSVLDGSSAAADAGDSRPLDCTKGPSKDAGSVPDPKVEAVVADAGKTHQMFGASKAFEGLHYMRATKGLSDFDYLEEEFFFTGTSPAYTSRMVVHRPKDPAKFTGTVILEWYNVTGGIDIAPLWTLSREYMMRAGHVHIGVSAQGVGANALKTYDAERYAAINHPGDTAANAIFAQAAMAIRSQTDKLLGPCMPVQAVVAAGQSQSSSMLSAYLRDKHPTDKIFDGFLLHSDPSGSVPAQNPDVPVFVVLTMSEGTNPIVSQPNLAQWEVAGATHNDTYLTTRGGVEQGGDGQVKLECTDPMNDFPSFWVYSAALDWLHRWVRKGEKPPSAPALKTTKDEDGNVQGGVRIQDIDIPIATYTAGNAPTNLLDFISILGCGLSGAVVPLTSSRLTTLYPTHDDYIRKYTEAADKALAAGFLLQADRDYAIELAKKAPIPK